MTRRLCTRFTVALGSLALVLTVVAYATEQYANNAQTTLSASIASGSTTLTVASAASFPTSGNFRIKIDSEYLLVTAVSGTTFTVTRGIESTLAASHASGATVTHVLTAGGLQQIIADAVAAITESQLSLSDVTTNNVSITKHGFVPKAPNSATQYLDGTGAWSVPAGAGGSGDFVKIEEKTPTATGTTTFSALGTYTHLRLVWSVRSTAAAGSTGINIQFNGDTAAHYDTEITQSFGSSPSAFESLGGTSGGIGNVAGASAAAGLAGAGELVISDYRGTSLWKYGLGNTIFQTGTSSGAFGRQLTSIAWRSTSAITSITVVLTSGNYDTGSKLTLYGMN